MCQAFWGVEDELINLGGRPTSNHVGRWERNVGNAMGTERREYNPEGKAVALCGVSQE